MSEWHIEQKQDYPTNYHFILNEQGATVAMVAHDRSAAEQIIADHGAAERLAAAESRIDLLRRLLHREHFFEAGRLGFTPPLYGEPCPPCDAVKSELAAIATVPSEPSGGAEGAR